MLSTGTVTRIAAILFIGIPLSACGNRSMSPAQFEVYVHDLNVPRVVFQICVPNKTAYFDDVITDVTDMPVGLPFSERAKIFANPSLLNKYRGDMVPSKKREYQTVRRWRNTSDGMAPRYIGITTVKNTAGVRSSGSGQTRVSDSTERDQPVFEEYSYERQTDLVAVEVRTPGSGGSSTEKKRRFWFVPPKQIPSKQYTSWIMPISEEGELQDTERFSTSWLLTHGREARNYPVGKNVPMIRFSLISQREYGAKSREKLRARDAAALQYQLEHGRETDSANNHLVDAKEQVIPACQ